MNRILATIQKCAAVAVHMAKQMVAQPTWMWTTSMLDALFVRSLPRGTRHLFVVPLAQCG